ncbi:MAG: hypothetical protein ACREYF_17165, partial [Gammaproteobacteria bacterium]
DCRNPFRLASRLYLGGAALVEHETVPVGCAIACAASLLPDADLTPLFWLSTHRKAFAHRTTVQQATASKRIYESLRYNSPIPMVQA